MFHLQITIFSDHPFQIYIYIYMYTLKTTKESPESALGLRPRLLHDHFQDEHDLVKRDASDTHWVHCHSCEDVAHNLALTTNYWFM